MNELKKDKRIIQDIESIIVHEVHMDLSKNYEPQYSCAIYEIVATGESTYMVKNEDGTITDCWQFYVSKEAFDNLCLRLVHIIHHFEWPDYDFNLPGGEVRLCFKNGDIIFPLCISAKGKSVEDVLIKFREKVVIRQFQNGE